MSNVLLPVLHLKTGTKVLESISKTNSKMVALLKKFFKNSYFNINLIQGKQVNDLIGSTEFRGILSNSEMALWDSFGKVVRGFLGKHRDERYSTLINHFYRQCKNNNIILTPKLHTLFFHVDRFTSSNSDFSDEAGEAFHHVLMKIYVRYCVPEEKLAACLSDYLWRNSAF